MTDYLNKIIDEAIDYVDEQLVTGNKRIVLLEYVSMNEDDADLFCRHFNLSYDVSMEHKLERDYKNNKSDSYTKITIKKREG